MLTERLTVDIRAASPALCPGGPLRKADKANAAKRAGRNSVRAGEANAAKGAGRAGQEDGAQRV